MNNIAIPEETLFRDSIKRVQLNQDKVAFNLLLDKYYKNSCKYAIRFLNNRTYSNMISWYFEEVESYVFLAFWKAVKNYKLEDTEGVLSFKNYLYQLIKFETLSELKSNFNWQCIPKAEKKWYIDDSRKKVKTSFDVCVNLEMKEKSDEISKFLESKNSLYPLIWQLKVEEVKNKEICEKLGITKAELKSRWQYIKRLILEKYSYMDVTL